MKEFLKKPKVIAAIMAIAAAALAHFAGIDIGGLIGQ